ncbi:hypothetical protein [Streptomyces sp. NPDC058657]|uniref:hypothetical protein n=1 Tax=Streptomyces sp. NPDC058657 TaxID=3346579 RepID=UPI00364DE5B3
MSTGRPPSSLRPGQIGAGENTVGTRDAARGENTVEAPGAAAFLAYLDGRQLRWRLTLDAAVASAGDDPRARLLAVFDALREWACSSVGGFRSNAFVQAQYEAGRAGGVARTVIAQHKHSLRSRMLALAEATGAPDPGLLVDQLLLIYEGSVVNHSLGTVAESADKAHRTARQLIAAATPQPLDGFWAGRG